MWFNLWHGRFGEPTVDGSIYYVTLYHCTEHGPTSVTTRVDELPHIVRSFGTSTSAKDHLRCPCCGLTFLGHPRPLPPRARRMVGRIPDVDGWTVAGETFEQVRALVADGVSFALASAAEDRGESFDEARLDHVEVEHYVPAPA